MIGHSKFGLKSLTAELLTTTLIGIALLGPAAAQGSPPGDALNKEEPSLKAGTTENLLTLLPLLLTSPDRKQLAADLEASIRKGDLKKAENSLNSAIEVGTLAIVLVDHLKDPDFITTLQGLGIRGDDHPTPVPATVDRAAETCAAPSAAATANLADMQQALEQEQSFSGRISQTLTGLMEERNALEARLEKETASQALTASEMQKTLQRERDQAQAAIQELERLRKEHGALQAAREQDKASVASHASELDAALRQERERRDNAERQFASAAKKLRDLQAVNEERAASEAARVAELEKALTWARMRSDMLTQELVDTTEELHALQEPHRSRATPVVFRLAATGTEPPLAPSQQEAPLQEPLPPLPAERKPSLADAARVLPNVTSALPSKEPTSVVVASLPDGVQPLPLGATTTAPAKTESPPAEDPKVSAPAEVPKTDDRLTIRAEELFRKGDVSGARLLLERALDGGNARAAFLLAETFDPNVLSKLGVLGIRGDDAKARAFYARARDMGIAQAGERMEALK
ncbi:hypothetical protein KHP60_05640 [Microvirga sp. 3-52]|uniref:hypothetical protein n=1 Tax=Microvirga sp. 3-52 TaxID=2792425 RepID=UPI001AC3D00A|nr:hypothetical protein [Microvirga sp. 3-52]MBO1904222.1 hypothetical protein [Microvirga sp. 3-52]MBS7451830.1 hypothetical protein [Microvirga sp. 3-52]